MGSRHRDARRRLALRPRDGRVTPARTLGADPSPKVPVMPLTRRSIGAVATILHPSERARVDAAGDGVYQTLHRRTLDEVAADLRAQRARAILLSVACCGPIESPHLAQLVREFPRIPTIALLSRVESATPQAVLSLGQCGIRELVDVRESAGWRDLRDALADEKTGDIVRLALGALSLDLIGVPEECWRFFDALFRAPTACLTVRMLAGRLGVLPSTLMSRFFRAELPAPKRYLAYARLMHAARAFENPGLSIANVSNQLDYSSPQSFSRHVRTLIGLSALEFRARYDGEGMLHRFREELVLPFLEKLRRFYPLSHGTRWSGVLRALA